jgi:hypothetical protein
MLPKKIKNYQIIGAIVIVFLIILVMVYKGAAFLTYNPNQQMVFGVTFSRAFAEYLGLEWKEVYKAALQDLNVKYLRLPAYWADIEPAEDHYNFTDLDWQIDQATAVQAKIILVLGRRQPRWPECHDPAWAKSLSPEDAHRKILKNIEILVNRYKNNQTIEMWQVENEPLLDFFGQCPKMSKEQLQKEIDLVKSLDNRQILVTDSGELSTWYPLIKMSDYFGTTIYRKTYNRYFGYWSYFFIPPSFYRLKAFLWGKPLTSYFVAELQAEPWFPDGPLNSPLSEHYKTMNSQQLAKNAEFAKKTNFSRAYFWGVEWWYWLKTTANDSSVWQAAQQYFKN